MSSTHYTPAPVRFDEDARWFVLYRNGVAVVCNLADRRQAIPLEGAPAGVLLASAPGFAFRPGAVWRAPRNRSCSIISPRNYFATPMRKRDAFCSRRRYCRK